ncbi:MAG: glucokinase [Hyphomicrobium sp.]|uniref:glucokinase n=1 Tax=Hyphomicrobium sp. TaxID=82 RepID=UPI001320AD94|nr:glucokinase [Hyphomicrobium sp.]KAB2940287.1 MAG: glucokinase [Hyphomicrobium sp.]MBZ0211102.1 glucokinase [Hyphomicrobium sp.]
MSATDFGLVGDIGATNARFALIAPDGALSRHANLLCEDYSGIGAAIEAYLAQANAGRPAHAILAVATAPDGDRVSFTNNPWTFSITQLAESLGVRRLRVINDFHANALAVPRLAASDRVKVGGGEPVAETPMGVIGPGSGLGVSTVVWTGTSYMPVPGEGGHVTMAAADDAEGEVLALLRRRFDHVSAERVLSGPGLVNLYNALCEIGGRPSPGLTAAQITDPATAAEDACAKRAVAMFCAMLGTVAGNLALTLGARGGIYIAGGIVPKLGAAFAQSQFRARFEDKGRFRTYLSAIPTFVVIRPDAALLGAAQMLDTD